MKTKTWGFFLLSLMLGGCFTQMLKLVGVDSEWMIKTKRVLDQNPSLVVANPRIQFLYDKVHKLDFDQAQVTVGPDLSKQIAETLKKDYPLKSAKYNANIQKVANASLLGSFSSGGATYEIVPDIGEDVAVGWSVTLEYYVRKSERNFRLYDVNCKISASMSLVDAKTKKAIGMDVSYPLFNDDQRWSDISEDSVRSLENGQIGGTLMPNASFSKMRAAMGPAVSGYVAKVKSAKEPAPK